MIPAHYYEKYLLLKMLYAKTSVLSFFFFLYLKAKEKKIVEKLKVLIAVKIIQKLKGK